MKPNRPKSQLLLNDLHLKNFLDHTKGESFQNVQQIDAQIISLPWFIILRKIFYFQFFS